MAAEEEEAFFFSKRGFNREERKAGKKDGTTERSNKLLAGCIDPDITG